MPERGYVVVRPDGTVMWETGAKAAYEAIADAITAEGKEGSQLALWLEMTAEGYRLKRLRVEDDDGRD